MLSVINMKLSFFVLLFICLSSYGQIVKFKEIKLKPDAKYYNTSEKTITYPLVLSANKKTDSLINAQIKADLFETDTENESVRKLLAVHISEYGLINLSYQVTYNSNGILSFSIYRESCGAYCSTQETYFNFDTNTGNEITISDLISDSKLDSFRSVVFADKVKALNKYKMEEKNLVDMDSVTINWALQQVDESCINNVNIDDFSLSTVSLEIKDICEFPHVIRSQEPSYELKYPFSSFSDFLKPRFKKILLR
jgi:hypothetical protein